VGQADIDGEDWGDIFANAIGGEHLSAPLGLADVVFEGMAWSVKSVKMPFPHITKRVRIISGRCSPNYSYGITDPLADIDATGAAVLGIYNERISIAKERYEPLRTSILIRNMDRLEFAIYEYDTVRYSPRDYEWRINRNGNLQGYEKATDRHAFTWQPHGSQFTVMHDVPESAQNFKVDRPAVLDFDDTMDLIGFTPDWVTIL